MKNTFFSKTSRKNPVTARDNQARLLTEKQLIFTDSYTFELVDLVSDFAILKTLNFTIDEKKERRR